MRCTYLFFLIALLASPALFASEPRDLGEYQVKDVLIGHPGKWSDGCVSEKLDDGSWSEPNDACGTRFRMIRSDEDLAFVTTAPNEDRLSTFLFTPALFHRHCSYLASSSAMNPAAILQSSICRATHLPRLDRDGKEGYFYTPSSHDPRTDPLVNAIVTMSVTGIPIGISRAYEVDLPRDSGTPDQFEVHAVVRGIVLFIPATLEYRFQMERIQ